MMVDLNFMLYTAKSHKKPPEVRLVKNNRKFVLVGETARANPT